jgi:uncharacterized protein
MSKIRILSLDGGGIRGIIPASVLAYIEVLIKQKTGNAEARLIDYFDLLVGTSTGGIICGMLLTPDVARGGAQYSASDTLQFYEKEGYNIFEGSRYRGLTRYSRYLRRAALYDHSHLESLFRKLLRTTRMSDLLKPCLITAYDLNARQAVFFNSREPVKDKGDYYLRDVLRSTSAAPTYFDPAYMRNIPGTGTGKIRMANIDGGVFANNPGMCAYAECRKLSLPGLPSNPGAKNMLMLSLGTGGGEMGMGNAFESHNWGMFNWATRIPDVMMDGSFDTVNHQLAHLFGSLEGELPQNYLRVDVPPDARRYNYDMDDASKANMERLKTAAAQTIQSANQPKEGQLSLDAFVDALIAEGERPAV